MGLIDEIGDLDDAIEAAAELAELEEGGYGEKTIETPLSPTEQMIVEMLGGAARLGVDLGSLRPTAADRLETLLDGVVAPLTRFDDPKGVYTHCFCVFE